MRALIFISFIFTFVVNAIPAQAAMNSETNFVITVKAKDAKFIGTAAGGAHVTIRNKITGDVVFDGTTYGAAGDTATIMADSLGRDAVIINEDSAKLQFSLEFWEPMPVTITATAPLGQKQSMISVSQDMILLPGKDYASGNGLVIEMPGFAVDVISPAPNSTYPLNPDVPLTLEANIMKLSGDKIAEGTPWPPERYLVETHIYKDGLYITSVEMPYAGEPGIYAANIKIPMPGIYRFHVTAFDSRTKEAGMDTTTAIFTENEQAE